MSKITDINSKIARLKAEKANILEQEVATKRAKKLLPALNVESNLSNKYVNGLYKQRKKLGISQTALAKASGMSRTTINNIERGTYDPSLERFLRINAVLKYWEINKLLEDEVVSRIELSVDKLRIENGLNQLSNRIKDEL